MTALLNIPGYEIDEDLRRDRCDTNQGVGRGLLVYVRAGLSILPLDNHDGIDFNQYCRFGVGDGQDRWNVYLVYGQPSLPASNMDSLCDLVETAEEKCLFSGDFNLPGINWSTGQADARSRQFLEAAQDRGITQLIEQPTHIKSNLLDLVLTNNPDGIVEVNCKGRLERLTLLTTLTVHNTAKPTETKKDWRKADWNAIRSNLAGVNWNGLLNDQSTEEAWRTFRSLRDKAVQDHVPLPSTR